MPRAESLCVGLFTLGLGFGARGLVLSSGLRVKEQESSLLQPFEALLGQSTPENVNAVNLHLWLGLLPGYIGIMDKKMETTIVYQGYIGIMHKKMETRASTHACGHFSRFEASLPTLETAERTLLDRY